MKKIIAFTVADEQNMRHALALKKSFNHFHPDIELKIYTQEDVGEKINYYRQKPMFMKDLIGEYDLVLGLDADQLVVGSLDHIFNMKYDAGVVMNFNRTDIKQYQPVTVLDISPTEYMNCGLVAVQSKEFVEHWWNLCNTNHFNNLQYKEQDLLNILIHYGNYDVNCFDFPNNVTGYGAWNGLIAKGEYPKAFMRDGKIVLPKADDNYPEQDKEIKVLHLAGGGNEKRILDSYRLYFNQEIVEYIDNILKEKNE